MNINPEICGLRLSRWLILIGAMLMVIGNIGRIVSMNQRHQRFNAAMKEYDACVATNNWTGAAAAMDRFLKTP